MNIPIKQAEVIKAEKDKVKEVKLFLQDNKNKDYETIQDLLDTIEKDREWCKKHGGEQEYLNTPITLQLCDIEGQVVEGKVSLSTGQLIDGSFVLTGSIDNVAFIKEEE